MITLLVDARNVPAGVLRETAVIVKDHPGDELVILRVLTSAGERVMEFGDHVASSDFFYDEMRALGIAAVPGVVP